MRGFRKDFNFETRFNLKTDVKNKKGNFVVSTVDLGLDHSFGVGKPLYYETMVFKKIGTDIRYVDLYTKRYETVEEALLGHEETVISFNNGTLDMDIN